MIEYSLLNLGFVGLAFLILVAGFALLKGPKR